MHRNLVDRRRLLQLGAGTAAALAAPWLRAQGWPTKPIRLVVPFAPGGSSEIIARATAAEMGKLLGQSVFVDNKPGGAGNVAMTEVARADDQHTLILGHIGTLAVNPFIFEKLSFDVNKDFKPVSLLAKVPTRDAHVVNVSAMEGQFYRRWKTDKHPHTNMAKAALNMMTRTSAVEYVRDGIHMNSVDTGWVTDEDPVAHAERKTRIHGFHPPLDIVDGAARIVDPLFDGVNTGTHVWGLFLKDYKPAPW